MNTKSLIFTLDALISVGIALTLVSGIYFYLSQSDVSSTTHDLFAVGLDSLALLEHDGTLETAALKNNLTEIGDYLDALPNHICADITIRDGSKKKINNITKLHCQPSNQTSVVKRVFLVNSQPHLAEMELWFGEPKMPPTFLLFGFLLATWDGGHELKDLNITNIGSTDLVIVAAVVEWSPNGTELIKEIELENEPDDPWDKSCSWGCTPTGAQPSGTYLDFGSHDITIAVGATVIFHEIEWEDGDNMDGKTITITFFLDDGRSVSSGPFTP